MAEFRGFEGVVWKTSSPGWIIWHRGFDSTSLRRFGEWSGNMALWRSRADETCQLQVGGSSGFFLTAIAQRQIAASESRMT